MPNHGEGFVHGFRRANGPQGSRGSLCLCLDISPTGGGVGGVNIHGHGVFSLHFHHGRAQPRALFVSDLRGKSLK